MQREYKGLTEQELLDADYRRFESNGIGSHVALYQKKTDSYFINAELYDFKGLGGCPYRFAFEWKALFMLKNGKSFYATYMDEPSLPEIEQFFADIFAKMGCVSNI